LFLLILLFTSLSLIAQETEDDLDKKTYLYLTFEDFTNNNTKYVGEYVSYSWSSLGTNKIYVKNGTKETKININKYWGFKINGKVFRLKKVNPKIPLLLLKSKDINLYIDGYMYLHYLEFFSTNSSRTTEAIFYSDDLNSKIYKVDKLVKHHKNTTSISNFRECIKKGTKRYGYQAKFNSYMKCVEKY